MDTCRRKNHRRKAKRLVLDRRNWFQEIQDDSSIALTIGKVTLALILFTAFGVWVHKMVHELGTTSHVVGGVLKKDL